MAKKIDPKKWYLASDAADLLGLTLDGLKNKLRKKEIAGEQQGYKKKWHVLGKTIIKEQKRVKLK